MSSARLAPFVPARQDLRFVHLSFRTSRRLPLKCSTTVDKTTPNHHFFRIWYMRLAAFIICFTLRLSSCAVCTFSHCLILAACLNAKFAIALPSARRDDAAC